MSENGRLRIGYCQDLECMAGVSGSIVYMAIDCLDFQAIVKILGKVVVSVPHCREFKE